MPNFYFMLFRFSTNDTKHTIGNKNALLSMIYIYIFPIIIYKSYKNPLHARIYNMRVNYYYFV